MAHWEQSGDHLKRYQAGNDSQMNKRVRIDLTSEQLGNLRRAVFANVALSAVLRRQAAKRILPLPSNGTPIDFYYDGQFIGQL